ncbi:hypothetical protein ACKVWC_008021 [Pyricularia oryzae]
MYRATLAMLAAWPSQLVLGAPTDVPSDVYSAGGLTLLTYNDLSNDPKNGSAAVLVHAPAGFPSAEESCRKLGETLWSPDTASFTDGLNSSLSYQIWQESFPKSQLFWVSKASSGDCRAINYRGELKEVDCAGPGSSKLPALCTQSAPVLTTATNNVRTDFIVNQRAGDLVYQGFRDFFVWKFRGIRFAAKPERFEYARPYEPTPEERSAPIPALFALPECLQVPGEVPDGSNEDCLGINIWTPYLPPTGPSSCKRPSSALVPKRLKPVMFYIYGGALRIGSGRNVYTDGTMLASRGDVVVVSVNYRVGSLGWMVLGDGVHNGNYGLSDVIAGLEWVKENIASFGGDPDRVTIFGYSAGAWLIRALMASPKAKGLFHAAIAQSGPAGIYMAEEPVQQPPLTNEAGFAYKYDSIGWAWENLGKKVVSEVGCATDETALGCLRAVDGTAFLNTSLYAIGITVDGKYIDSDRLTVNSSDNLASDVAFMTGIDRDEAGNNLVSVPVIPGVPLADIVPSIVPAVHSEAIAAAVRSPAFGIPSDPTPAEALDGVIRIATDAFFTCLEQATVYSAARHSTFESLWAYSFNRTYNFPGYTKPHCETTDPEQLEYKKCHGGDHLILFGTMRRGELPDRDGRDLPFSRVAMDHWAAFGTNRDPNPDPAYLAARGYWDTLETLQRLGPWERADVSTDAPIRLLQVQARMDAYSEVEQCKVLRQPLDYFEPGSSATN